MQGLIVNIIIWLSILSAIALAVGAVRKERIGWGWYAAGMAVFAGYAIAVSFGGDYIPVQNLFPGYDLHWNWAGKIAAIGYTLIITALLCLAVKRITPAGAGFTLRQEQGSILPAFIAMGLLAAMTIGVEMSVKDGTDTSLERLLFQATMPGLDEEPMMRGIALLLMNEAFGRNWRV
ncbi:MAG: hypothetical protein RIE56_12190, partial [Amphiplicatus sp.]